MTQRRTALVGLLLFAWLVFALLVALGRDWGAFMWAVGLNVGFWAKELIEWYLRAPLRPTHRRRP